MNKVSMIAATGITGLALASSVVSPAFAWHPKGQIVKYVQNVTTSPAGSTQNQLIDANDAKTAVAAKPGDTLKYVIVVSNTGAVDNSGNNDMAKTVLNDTLPTGVELTTDASKRQITEDLGLIKPGKSITKEYTVKVTAKVSGLIENKACFTGDSTVNDNPQSGCDVADVNVTVPPAPVVTTTTTATTPTPAPVTPVTPAVAPAATLPNTGPANILLLGTIATIGGYALSVLRLKLRTN